MKLYWVCTEIADKERVILYRKKRGKDEREGGVTGGDS